MFAQSIQLEPSTNHKTDLLDHPKNLKHLGISVHKPSRLQFVCSIKYQISNQNEEEEKIKSILGHGNCNKNTGPVPWDTR